MSKLHVNKHKTKHDNWSRLTVDLKRQYKLYVKSSIGLKPH